MVGVLGAVTRPGPSVSPLHGSVVGTKRPPPVRPALTVPVPACSSSLGPGDNGMTFPRSKALLGESPALLSTGSAHSRNGNYHPILGPPETAADSAAANVYLSILGPRPFGPSPPQLWPNIKQENGKPWGPGPKPGCMAWRNSSASLDLSILVCNKVMRGREPRNTLSSPVTILSLLPWWPAQLPAHQVLSFPVRPMTIAVPTKGTCPQ